MDTERKGRFLPMPKQANDPSLPVDLRRETRLGRQSTREDA